MDNELDLDMWLGYFKVTVEMRTQERDYLSKLHEPTHSQFEQLLNGPREILLDKAREFLRESIRYQLILDSELRLCRNQAKKCKQSDPNNSRCEELRDLCAQLHEITTQVLPYVYWKEQEFLQKILTPVEYEGLRRDIINDLLLAGRIARGEV